MNPCRDVPFHKIWRVNARDAKALRNFRQELLLRVELGMCGGFERRS